ncbi:TetR/AcrR family transcriptional regulator [Lewinella sp. LCG006]|uniref:TetR/AcrR family transcriptional regulator n=1 Tax=Lewinella sp. LCG006 TaxID=3231911 RepID=UPI0034604C9B
MKKISLDTGRVNQKAKTRTKILVAAKELMQQEKLITLEDVAEKANISRATIYRYYAKIDLLITEASLDIHHKSPDELLDEVKEMGLEDRIIYVQKHYTQLAQKHEVAFRRYLSAVLLESVTSKKKLRGARRVKSLNNVLKPFKNDLDSDTFKKLVTVASVLMGIDSLIVCKDVCDLDNEEANATLQWALEMIFKGISSGKE